MGNTNGTTNRSIRNGVDDFLTIDDYRKLPLVTFEQSVVPLISLIPEIEIDVQRIKEKCNSVTDGLTFDQTAAMMLYSIIDRPSDLCLHTKLNRDLSSSNKENFKPWFLYLKLFFSALVQLPSKEGTVYRLDPIDWNTTDWTRKSIYRSNLILCSDSKRSSDPALVTIHGKTMKDITPYAFDSSLNLQVFLPGTEFQVIESIGTTESQQHCLTLQEIRASFLCEHSISNTSGSMWTRFKRSRNKKKSAECDHYRNSALEHRIMSGAQSWMIDLDKLNLIDPDMKIVVKYALTRNHCKRIRLRDNRITPDGSVILAHGLMENTSLESLDLKNNRLGDLGVKHLVEPIAFSCIKTLSFEANELTENGAVHLAQLIRSSRTLTELYLSNNHLGDRGVEQIALALTENDSNSSMETDVDTDRRSSSMLQHLYLGHNQISDKGVTSLSTMLKTNRRLTWLWLAGNEITNRGAEELLNTLSESNVTLEWLFLNSNKSINDDIVDVFLHMLKRNQSLKTLYLNDCNLSEQARRTLSKMTRHKTDFDLEV